MKKVCVLSLLLIVGLSCEPKKDLTTGEVAVVLDGYDQRMCACCGGQYVRVDKDTVRYRFFELPMSTEPPIDYGFARSFWIRFEPYEGTCGQSSPELITITSIRERY